MSTILPETDTRPPDFRRLELPDETCLENRLPDWFAAPRVLAGFTVFVGLIFLFFNYRQTSSGFVRRPLFETF